MTRDAATEVAGKRPLDPRLGFPDLLFEPQHFHLFDMKGMDEIRHLVDGMHQPWLNGLELLNECSAEQAYDFYWLIDTVLGGGLRVGFVVELVGPSSSGKTQVCLQAAANIASQHAGGVVFLDTGNSFSPRRIADFISQSCRRFGGMEGHFNSLDKVMSNISCIRVFDIFTLLDVLHQLESKLKHEMETGGRSVRILVVDSISSLITPVLGGGGPNGHALMVSAGVLLKKLAYEYNLCVLEPGRWFWAISGQCLTWVTNHMVGGDGGHPKPALGESWKSIPHLRLLLSRDQGSNTYSISKLK
ncbi:DNA repair protein RAD51 homolog 4-like protein [Drosera capensis]